MRAINGRSVYRSILLAFLAAALVRNGVAGKIKVVAADNVDFASYRTYQWVPPKVLGKAGIVENDPTLAPVIKAAVNRELTAPGLKEVASGGDLEVVTLALHAYIPQLEAMLFPMGMAGLDYATPIATMGRYNREGTFAVNLIDMRTNQSAWAGMITESIANKPAAGAKKIPGAAERLFKKYPVKK